MKALPQPLAVYALTSVGASLARGLALALPEASLFLPQGLASAQHGEQPFDRLAPALAANFTHYGGHVVLAATGIVVRALAPLLVHKAQDPAVVVVDQAGRFAVSLLSGHLGGANSLARRVAEILDGQAVITTATDSAGLPSLEMLAGELGLRVENLAALAKVSMALLEGQQPAVHDPQGWLWPALERRWPGLFTRVTAEQAAARQNQPLIWVGWRRLEPPPAWLLLRPPALTLGLGCNRGASAEEMEALVRRVLEDEVLCPACLACVASVTAKQDEAGLLELAARLGLPLQFYRPEELARVEVPNPSATVAKHMGVASVCEAAALLAANSRRLLVSKHKSPNATVALALAGPRDGSTS
jgi:cobalt-precorrin 5A hydrolase